MVSFGMTSRLHLLSMPTQAQILIALMALFVLSVEASAYEAPAVLAPTPLKYPDDSLMVAMLSPRRTGQRRYIDSSHKTRCMRHVLTPN
jgi:hypothetical protein